MNEQQLQQILTIQQAIAAAATAAVINSLLNPQQAAGLASANALSDSSSNDLQLAAVAQHLQQQQQQQQENNRRGSPSTASPITTNSDCNNRIQDLLMQLQQQAALGQSPVALNLNLATQQHHQSQGLNSPIRSPVNRLTSAQELNAATNSNTLSQASPIKKLKTRHHHQQQQVSPLHNQQQQQQPFHNRSSEATSKPQHSTPKNHSTISNLSSGGRNSNIGNQNTSSSSSSAFMANNVGLPRKLVRGQDVWLGRGAEQTRQILKCMWCGTSFKTLAEMTQHMKITQHYTNIISQEQITSWRQPESSEANSKHSNKQSIQSRGLDNHDDHSSDKFNDTDREDSFSNDDDLDQQKDRPSQNNRLVDHNKSDSTDNNSMTGSIHDDYSPNRAQKNSPSSKPLTRSRKREHDTQPIKREGESGRDTSPATSSSSQTCRNSCGKDLKEDFEANNKECKTNGNDQDQVKSESDSTAEAATIPSATKIRSDEDHYDNLENRDDDETPKSNGDSIGKDKLRDLTDEEGNTLESPDHEDVVNDDRDDASAELDDPHDNVDHERDNVDEEQASETNESVATSMTTSGARLSGGAGDGGGLRGDTGDPLSALETMVEKSFDPRMQPGGPNGGILQRLGIDEEVCPPWQGFNMANWYAAATYGHPAQMAAALLAAGINLQNGIKLSKNVAPRKNED